VYAGFLLVFIPAFGEFAIPTLLGGAKQMFWGSLIVNKFLRSRDWRLGAALAIVGILLPVFIFWSGYIIRRVIASTRLKNGKNGPDYYRDYWSYTETLREED
jgi:ABC-type spermidine/putrescine transport system permease subunit I